MINYTPTDNRVKASEKELLCALAAISEGATWTQIREMFPLGSLAHFARQLWDFHCKWLPSEVRLGDPTNLRASIKNYIRQHTGPTPEWMTNG